LRSHSALQFRSFFIRQIDWLALIHHSRRRKDTDMTMATQVSSNNSQALH
jgi:hypothetical protein